MTLASGRLLTPRIVVAEFMRQYKLNLERREIMTKQEDKGLVLYQHAKEVAITDQPTYDFAATFLTEIKTRMKAVEEAMDPQCKAAHSAWQTALSQKKQYLTPYQNAEVEIKSKMSQYQLEQRRIQEEAERRAMEEAERQAEKERQALLKKADRTKNEDKAEELRQQAEMVFVPAISSDHSVNKVDGISTTDTVEIRINDIREFLQWLATGPMDPDAVVSVKIAPLKQYLKMTGGTKIPGCQVSKDIRISAKGR